MIHLSGCDLAVLRAALTDREGGREEREGKGSEAAERMKERDCLGTVFYVCTSTSVCIRCVL